MNYYLESSACVRLFAQNQLSTELNAFVSRVLESPTSKIFTSWLTRIEVLRTLRRLGVEIGEAEEFLDSTIEFRHNDSVSKKSSAVLPKTLKTLDAIHLAIVAEFPGLDLKLISYDRQLAEAAKLNGLDVISPGL